MEIRQRFSTKSHRLSRVEIYPDGVDLLFPLFSRQIKKRNNKRNEIRKGNRKVTDGLHKKDKVKRELFIFQHLPFLRPAIDKRKFSPVNVRFDSTPIGAAVRGNKMHSITALNCFWIGIQNQMAVVEGIYIETVVMFERDPAGQRCWRSISSKCYQLQWGESFGVFCCL